MDSLWPAELSLIQAFQSLGVWLIAPADFLSFLGREEFYLLIMPLLLWCLNAPLGFRVGLALLISTSVMTALKLGFHTPRPYWLSSTIVPLSVDPSFGLPSGHAQNAASVWGRLGVGARVGWVRWATLALIILIGLARIYLGLHFLSDVIAGWLVGGLILWGLLRWERPVGEWLRRQGFQAQALVAFLASLVLVGVNLLGLASAQRFVVPVEWERLARAAPAGEFDPFNLDDAISASGTLFGLALGWAWTLRRGGFPTTGSLIQRAARYGIGLIGVLVIWQGLGALLPREPALLAAIFRYGRYALIGLWVAGVAPWLFVRLGLTPRATPVSQSGALL